MPLIYGGISNTSSINTEKIKILKGDTACHKSKHFKIKWNNFNGGALINPGQPYQPEDFCHIDEDNEILTLLSGFIYNKLEIEDLLQIKSGYTDANLINLLFLKFGEKFVTYLNGDFAIFIYSKSINKIFLFCDHLGIHPLGYTIFNDCLYFSSDTIMLCKTFNSDLTVNKKFLVQFVQDSDLVDYRTLPNENVKKILPGHYITWNSNKITENKYWFPENIRIDKSLNINQVVLELKQLVKDAVKIRSDHRFFASSHLSGGLDSGLVAALALKEYQHQSEFYGLTWAPKNLNEFVEKEYDERARLLDMENNFTIQTVFCDISSEEYKKYLSVWYYYSYLVDEHKTLEECKTRNINLVFSGWGGDEFLSIDNAGFDFDLFFGLHWKTFFKRNPIHQPKKLIRRFVFGVLFPFLKLSEHYLILKENWYLKYFKYPFNKKKFPSKKKFHFRSRREVHLNYLYNYHIPWRTETWAILGYHNNVEYRYPLLDRRIVEYMLKIPSKVIFNNDYYRNLIREISDGILPDSIRLHKDKYDGAHDSKFEKMIVDAATYLFNQISYIAENPEFDFINFNQITEDIANYKNGKYKGDTIGFLSLLANLKQMHEFTKGYHN